MADTKVWIKAFRLRTLPLSLSSVLLAGLLAFANNEFSALVFVMAIITTLCLQILSNLANDYGDSKKGTDNDQRIGPKRTVQSGEISFREMKTMVIVFVFLSLVSGILLIYFGLGKENLLRAILFLVIGLTAIFAALKYTIGKNPYGYVGLGDLFVFLFFGLTGFLGTYYLHTQRLSWDLILPASAVGFLSVGVLNLNNMRDKASDAMSGKRTLVVKIGIYKAKIYHASLIVGAIFSGLLYAFLNYQSISQFLFILSLPLLVIHLKTVLNNQAPALLDPELKKLAISTLIFSICFGIGFIIA